MLLTLEMDEKAICLSDPQVSNESPKANRPAQPWSVFCAAPDSADTAMMGATKQNGKQ
jgi:hypothetical protein